jgi:hydroxymethylglutaryl-CoA lyase
MTTIAPIQLVECPRDAMQGWKTFIPTDQKISYLQTLMDVGFHTLDAGSFVSPKAIPQMADTAAVLSALDWKGRKTDLLVIVANERGAAEAAQFEQVAYMGFPFSISPTFQFRNTNSTQAESLTRVRAIQEIAQQANKQLVVYLSMGFGNPYGDLYSADMVWEWASKLVDEGVTILSLADTVGLAKSDDVYTITRDLILRMPAISIGVHLHAAPHQWEEKLAAALRAGCTRIDGALKGIGGCPMADDHLVGNMDSALMIPYLQQQGRLQAINQEALNKALQQAALIFN